MEGVNMEALAEALDVSLVELMRAERVEEGHLSCAEAEALLQEKYGKAGEP